MPYLGEVDEEAEWSPEDSTTTSTTSSVYEEVSTLLPTMRPAQDDVPDIPLEFSDILPANRRSYDKMEPPKKDGIIGLLDIYSPSPIYRRGRLV